MENRTKIICTIGPTSESRPILEKMLRAGMDCVRLNFSHGTYAQFEKIIKTVRALSKEMGKEVAILQDLQGPKIRVGNLPDDGISVKEADIIMLTTSTSWAIYPSSTITIPVQYRNLPRDVSKGDNILIDDGLIELEVESVNAARTHIVCKVRTGGVIKKHKGINVPSASISANPLSVKDKRDIAFGIRHGVDYIGFSFVKDAANILELRMFLRHKKAYQKIIAKIERHEAIRNIEEIIQATDAVMVARGDLGVEIPAEQVPLYQKKIISLANTHGKPVIVATQMLDSMIENPRATRAEISDAATAIFDHADALMLTNETAIGKYPVEATRTLQKVAIAVEHDFKEHRHLLNFKRPEDMRITNATCLNACKLAHDIEAQFIVAITRTGYTAREIAKYRPMTPIIVFTPFRNVAREMQIVWGVTHTFVQYIHLDNPLAQIRKTLSAYKLVKNGDEIVVCNAGFGRKEKLISTTMI